ncbi:carbon-nitrogen hydrolase family protein [Atlantibacter sp.]|uniref:carbon-nitrogen hydrolase family protein n=1 Tax=Atlantibacter sp. TaxID=1903473 RepID=UPI0028B1A81D|nr:carbon-nitrogen hydrolase family protein [Atlantibacter sp.]
MTTWNVAAAQYAPRPDDVAANVSHHLKFIATAASEQIDVLLFPEFSLSGFPSSSWSAPDPDTALFDPINEAAQRHKMTIIAGLSVNTPDGGLSGGLIFLPDGSRQLCLQNHSQPLHDLNGLTVLNNRIIGTGSKRIALAINHTQPEDLWTRKEASLYMCGHFISELAWNAEVADMQCCAFENHIAVLQVNPAVAPDNQTAVGRSACWDEQGQLIVRAEAGELLVVARRKDNGWHGEVIPLR